MKKIVVIGAGPAGLMAAISAAQNKAEVLILEKNDRPARKLLITGKGRCNVTNNCTLRELIDNMAKNEKFLYSAFSSFNSQDTMSFFENHGVALKTERGRRVFPVSDKAVDIADALVFAAKKLNCKIKKGRAEKILTENNSVKAILLESGETFFCDRVILATGGASYPLTGSTGDGYKIAEDLGICVEPIFPSLVPLECLEGFCTKLAGLTLNNVVLSVYENDSKKPVFSELGDLLFTHFGISGPLVLSASAKMRKKNAKYTAFIDLKPALSFEQLNTRILRDFSMEQNKEFSNSLYKLMPKSLVSVIVRLSKIDPHKKVNQISREERENLCSLLKALKLNITAFRPIEEAIVTSGGISVKEIDPKTMASKKIEGLFFCGEIIDVDAYTGGYNLQIAFSTGFLAGENAAK